MRFARRRARLLAVLVFCLSGLWPPSALAAPSADPTPPASPDGVPLLIPPGCSYNFDSKNNNTPVLIPDANISNTVPGIVTSTIPISITGIVASVWDVNVQTYISHTYNSDLEVFLISPAGTRVTLTSKNGANKKYGYHGTNWDDQAGVAFWPPVTLANFVDKQPLTFAVPEEPLGAFIGENANGPWRLVVQDDVFSDTGHLEKWSIIVTALTQTPVTSYGSATINTSPDNISDGGHLSLFGFGPHLGALSALTLTTVITYPEAGDLDVKLVSPTGITLTVASRVGNTFANVFAGTRWYDKAGADNPPGALTDNTLANGVVETRTAPQESFSAVNGINPNGLWRFQVFDQVNDGQTGQLGPVRLDFAGQTCRPDIFLYGHEQVRFGRPDAALPIEIVVYNFGAAASQVRVTATVPSGYSVLSATVPGGSCSLPVGKLVCTVASMASQQATSIHANLHAPLTPNQSYMSMTTSASPGVTYPNSVFTLSPVSDFVTSANGNPWDVADPHTNSTFYPDSGSLPNGGQDAFSNFGQVVLRVSDGSGALLDQNVGVLHLGLSYAAGARWETTTPVTFEDVQVARSLLAPAGANWLRYVDTFTNTGPATRRVLVAWGGYLGSGGQTRTAADSSGNLSLTSADTWAVTAAQASAGAVSTTPPLGFVLRSPTDTSYLGPYDYTVSSAITTTQWVQPADGDLGHVYQLILAPGATQRLAYFVYRGLAEGSAGPAECDYYGGCLTPATGAQVALAASTAAALAAAPPFCDLSPAVRASLINWPGITEQCVFLPYIAR